MSTLFDAYAFFYIQSFPVTLFTIVSIIYVIQWGIKGKFKSIKITKQNVLISILILYVIFNYIFRGCHNITSFLQTVYFLTLSLIAYRKELSGKFDGYCSLYQKIMTYISIYGIYQFVGRIFGFPLTDLILKDHMVTGYNWTNATYILGQTVYRSNAFFREPSYFGQMLAISLILYMPIFFERKKKEKKVLLSIIIQGLAMITTLSGTGMFMLIISFAVYSCIMVKKRSFWRKIIPISVLAICVIIYVLIFTSFGNYFVTRLNELFVYNRDASSGFVRFRSWIIVVKESWNSNMLLGSGIGTGSDYIAKYTIQYFGMTLNGFARVATELGIIGIGLWCGMIISFLRKKQNILLSNRYLVICCSLIPLIFMQEAFSSNLFWMLIMLINCRLYDIKKGV